MTYRYKEKESVCLRGHKDAVKILERRTSGKDDVQKHGNNKYQYFLDTPTPAWYEESSLRPVSLTQKDTA
jgi:hypothetical protein